MINILDCNALNLLRDRGIQIRKEHSCYVPDEIEEEFLGNPRHDAWFQSAILISPHVDLGMYLAQYANILNRYKDFSFYNLKGLADVAVLANAAVLLKGGGINGSLFPEPIRIVTGDEDMRAFAAAEFAQNFSLAYPHEFADSL